ncbi:VQ motif-containing protein 4-like protein [Tanacetum coccineum]
MEEIPSPVNSPTSHGSTTIQTPPSTPKPLSRSEPNPYPTTFIQADTNSFKQVVQMLTGSSNPNTTNQVQHQDSRKESSSIPPIKTCPQKKQSFKLYERRNSLKNGLMINPNPQNPNAFQNPNGRQNPNGGAKYGYGSSPRLYNEILSPSILDFPSLVLSPVTPLPPSVGNSSEEDKAIAEKGFYLHPSPRTVEVTAEPRLLPLFPVTSPRMVGSPE